MGTVKFSKLLVQQRTLKAKKLMLQMNRNQSNPL